uniref:hypothetical protein n=1 Tax=Alistipes putredinis TaxID=28117 RepID=UPI003FD6D3DA
MTRGIRIVYICPDKSAFQQTASGYFRPFQQSQQFCCQEIIQTFLSQKSVVQKIRKEQVLTDDAGYEDISIRDERTTTLASAFEPAAVIEALAEIAASPQVWKIDGDKYEEVDILIREQTIGRHGSLGCIEISLRPRQETRCL